MKRAILILVGVLTLIAGGGRIDASVVQSTKSKPAVTKEIHINLNSATGDELRELPGIGKTVSARIVSYREANGSFKKLEELMNVKGIGEKLFTRLRPFVFLDAKASSKKQ